MKVNRMIQFILLSCAVFLMPDALASLNIQTDAPDWGSMAAMLFGGLALFLFGMDMMSDALKAVAGEGMKKILARLTTNRFMGAFTGAFVTAVIQSSSVTTVLVVGFISAGLMSASQSIGVIMGANIGTTITAQIIAFKVSKLALPIIAVGFAMLFMSKKERLRQYGSMIMGLGLIFYGMHVMSDAMQPLRSYQPFLDLMITMENPLLGILVSALFTALIQSSSATTGIVIVMASQGFITLPAGIALAFGANIGTCITAIIASVGKPREALRAAMVHVLFNVAGVLIWVGLIDQLSAFVSSISPSHPELSGLDRLAHETPRQIANAHTVFNVANTFIFIGFTGVFARLVEWLVPDRPLPKDHSVKPKYLEETLLSTPSLAMESARFEIIRIGHRVLKMLNGIGPAFLSSHTEKLKLVKKQGKDIDRLAELVISYLRKAGRGSLTDSDEKQLNALISAINQLKIIAELIDTELVSMGLQRASKKLLMSEPTRAILEKLQHNIYDSLNLCINGLEEYNQDTARNVYSRKNKIKTLSNRANRHLLERLQDDAPDRMDLYSIEISVVEQLRRIHYAVKQLSKNVSILAIKDSRETEKIEPQTDS